MPYTDKDGFPEIVMHPDIKTGRAVVRTENPRPIAAAAEETGATPTPTVDTSADTR